MQGMLVETVLKLLLLLCRTSLLQNLLTQSLAVCDVPRTVCLSSYTNKHTRSTYVVFTGKYLVILCTRQLA